MTTAPDAITELSPTVTPGLRTSWEFKSLFPLENYVDHPGDVLIGKPQEGSLIVVVLLEEREQSITAIERMKNCVRLLKEEHLNTISEEIGMDIEETKIGSAILVDPIRDSNTADAAVEYEGDSILDDKIYVWRVMDEFEADERNDRYRESDDEWYVLDQYQVEIFESEIARFDPELHEELIQGVAIQDRGYFPDFFIDSHHSIFLEQIITHIIEKSKEKG